MGRSSQASPPPWQLGFRCQPPPRPRLRRTLKLLQTTHVILCWLALLLTRVAENACGAAWPQLRRQLDRIAVGTFTGPAGTFRQHTEITPAQQDILARLGIGPPPKISQLTPAAPR